MQGTSSAHSQEEWITKFKANDNQTLSSFYADNYTRIEQHVLQNKGTKEDAKDIYQEAFTAAWRSIQLDKVVFENLDAFRGYLFRVAQFKWIDHLRRDKDHKPIGEVEIADPIPDPLDAEQEEYLLKVKSHFSKMENSCKDLLHRFYFLKQRMSEIAATFSWTEATAKNNKYRCLQKLRNLILIKNERP